MKRASEGCWTVGGVAELLVGESERKGAIAFVSDSSFCTVYFQNYLDST